MICNIEVLFKAGLSVLGLILWSLRDYYASIDSQTQPFCLYLWNPFRFLTPKYVFIICLSNLLNANGSEEDYFRHESCALN